MSRQGLMFAMHFTFSAFWNVYIIIIAAVTIPLGDSKS